MNKDFLNSVITLDNGEKWYICDQTEQDGNKYYLSLKLDDNNDPSGDTKIFREVKEDDRVFLDDELTPETYEYLSAIFITNYSNNEEKILDRVKNEEVE